LNDETTTFSSCTNHGMVPTLGRAPNRAVPSRKRWYTSGKRSNESLSPYRSDITKQQAEDGRFLLGRAGVLGKGFIDTRRPEGGPSLV
jgi:hypothetical protein